MNPAQECASLFMAFARHFENSRPGLTPAQIATITRACEVFAHGVYAERREVRADAA